MAAAAAAQALKFKPDKGRWLVRLRNGEGKMVKPTNLEAAEAAADGDDGAGGGGAHGRVHVFWGDARWSRTQLLGEIARGHWGLCQASVAELTSPPARRWAGLDGRMAFSPVTEMTEDFMRDAQRLMQAYTSEAQREGVGGDETTEDEEDDNVSVVGSP